MTAQNRLMGTFLKGYLYKNAVHDTRELLKRQAKMRGFDRAHLLRRMGLAQRSSFWGLGISCFCLGIVCGGAAALAFAPKPGGELRGEMKDRAMTMFGKAKEKASETRSQFVS